MFTNYSNQFGNTTPFAGFCGPINQFNGYGIPQFGLNPAFTNGFVPGFNPSFAQGPTGYATPWNTTPTFQTPGFQTPGFQTPSFQGQTQFGVTPWNQLSNGFAPTGHFVNYGSAPEFAQATPWASQMNNFAPAFGINASYAPYAGYQGYNTPTNFASPFNSYASQNQFGWTGSYAPATTPWNYTNNGNAWANGQSTGGFGAKPGVCRDAA